MARPKKIEPVTLFKRPDSKYWFCTYYVDGKRIKKNTQCTDETAAYTRAVELERQWANPTIAPTIDATLGDAIELLIEERIRTADIAGKAEDEQHTVTFYRQKCKVLSRIFGDDFKLINLKPIDVDRYIDKRRREVVEGKNTRVSFNTINKELIALRGALKLAKRHGLWLGDLAQVMPVRKPGKYVARKRWLTREELTKLMDAFSKRHPMGSVAAANGRDRAAWIAFAVATSARYSEACRACVEDVSPCGGYVTIRGTKTEGAARVVPIVAPWQKELIQYVIDNRNNKESQGLMFRPWSPHNINHEMNKACKRIGIERCSPNSLRHTTATWLYNAGVPQQWTKEVMGHKTTAMLDQVYAHTTPEMISKQIARAFA